MAPKLVAFFCIALFVANEIDAAKKGIAHSHSGKLKPFNHGPPALTISKGDQAKLDSGEMLTIQV